MRLFEKYSAVIVVAAAAAIVLWALSHSAIQKDWIFYWIAAALMLPFITKGMLSPLFVGTPFLMAIAMIYGTPSGVIAAAGYSLLASVTSLLARGGKAGLVFIGAAYMICEAFCYSMTYHLLRSVNLFVAIMAMACTSYLITSLVRNPGERWTDRFPLFLNPFLAAFCAAFLSAFHNPLMPLLALPVAAVIHHWTRLHEYRFGTGAAPGAPSEKAPG